MRSEKELREYLDEAESAVWLMRTSDGKSPEAIFEVLQKYPNFSYLDELCDDWDIGFYTGVMTTLRWVLGSEDKKMADT